MTQSTPLLDSVDQKGGIKHLDPERLPALAREVRAEIIDIVSETGGHLGASLGVVELTIALHYVFDFPHDRVIWDVGHQSYPHKLLTGRRKLMRRLRREDGASGFPRRAESPYDAFGTAHSSTSLSAAIGMATAARLRNENRHVIAVIGDGAMSAGMAYEAINNASDVGITVVLNDNDMSISPPVGGMSRHLQGLHRKLKAGLRQKGKDLGENIAKTLPRPVGSLVAEIGKRVEHTLIPLAPLRSDHGNWFEALGLAYDGPVDGHNLHALVEACRALKAARSASPGGRSSRLLHVVTEKGKGFPPAEQAADRLHGVTSFDKVTGRAAAASSNAIGFSRLFADELSKAATDDPRIVAVTAAMLSGTGLASFRTQHPDRCFDVGIAEQHAVTFAAGLACEGMIPVVSIYSTFLQRAYDQVVHDVALQGLPVRFIVDRAGFVGADGATHAGCYDMTMVTPLENTVVMAACDGERLAGMLQTALQIDDRPSFLRFARGTTTPLQDKAVALPIGRGRVVISGENVALLCLGSRVLTGVEVAAHARDRLGWQPTVVDAQFVKPLDTVLLAQLLRAHHSVVVVEDAAGAGLGYAVLSHLGTDNRSGLMQVHVRQIPDQFIDQKAVEEQYAVVGLDMESLLSLITDLHKQAS
ncbi:MAG: 1-deoxy-D-xylulose-5-phosphate synthase [Alphaproteobacteria bacterium]|nr:1-deoxy-D-xylulose-5-phosphate synthase [Alphaproteobacteria bacterium]